jgi:hypothetical protein
MGCTHIDFFRNFEGNLKKNRKKSGERSSFALFLQLLFLYTFKDVKAARKPDLTVLLMCDQLDYAISIRFRENGFTSDPHTRCRATTAKAQPLTRGLYLKSARD